MTTPRPAPLRRILRAGLISLAGLGTLAIALTSCRSLSKDEVRAALLALPKNSEIAAIGLSSLAFEADLGAGRQAFDLTYLHVSARAPAGERSAGALPVVIVPGTPDTLFAWNSVVLGGASPGGARFDGIATDREVFVLEVVGHGVAGGELREATFDACARYVNAAVFALGIERAHLVGNSYGGEFAWRAALDAPTQYASVTLVDSSGIARREGDFLSEEVVMRENPLARIGWALNSPERIEAALAPHFDVVPVGRVDEVFLICSNRENWHTMVELARDENGDRADELARLFLPTLLVWGADDSAYDPNYYLERFTDALPLATSVVMEDTGHYPHEQRPEQFVDEVERFFASVEQQR